MRERKKEIIKLSILLFVLLVGCGNNEKNTDTPKDDQTLLKVELDTVINKNSSLDMEEDEERQLNEPVNTECREWQESDSISK